MSCMSEEQERNDPENREAGTEIGAGNMTMGVELGESSGVTTREDMGLRKSSSLSKYVMWNSSLLLLDSVK